MKIALAPFGPKLRAMREAKGLRLRELARRARISPAFLSKVESGKEKPPAEQKLRALAKTLDCDPDVILAMAGRLPVDVVKIIQKYPKEYISLLRGFRSLNAEQLLGAQRTIMKTYQIEIPPEEQERWAKMLSGLKQVKPYQIEFTSAGPPAGSPAKSRTGRKRSRTG